MERVEIEVAALDWSLKLTPRQIARGRAAVMAHAEKQAEVIRRSAKRHHRRLATLETEQTRLLPLHYKGGVAESVMQRETERIETEHKALTGLLTRSEVQLADVRETLDHALTLTERPLETYLEAGNLGRRLLDQVFFTEIRVGTDGEITEAALAPVYGQFIAPRIVRRIDPEEAPERPLPAGKRPNLDPYLLGPRFECVQDGAPGRI